MTIITFNSIESEEGKKLLLEFPYDEDIINTIKKELPYTKTEYGYHKPGDPDSPLTGIYDSNCWFVNFDDESFNAIEEYLETPIPTEYWNEVNTADANNGTTDKENNTNDEVDKTDNGREEKHPERIQVTKTNKGRLTIEPWETTVQSLLREKINTEFTTDDIENNDFFEYITEKVDVEQGVLPIGVYECIKEKLETVGIETVTIDNRDVNECNNISWQFNSELVPHQRDTVNEIINQKNGVVLTSTGNDKGVIVCRAIYELNRDTTIVTTSEKQVENWERVIKEILDTNAERPQIDSENIDVRTYSDVSSLSDGDSIDTDIVVFDECQQRALTENVLEASLNCNAKYRIGLSPVSLKNKKTMFSEVVTGVGTSEIGYSMNELQQKGIIGNVTVSRVTSDVADTISSDKDSIVISDDESNTVNIREELNEGNTDVNSTTVKTMANIPKTQKYGEVILVKKTKLSVKEAQQILRVVNPEGDEKNIKYVSDGSSEGTLNQYKNTFDLLTENNTNTSQINTNTTAKNMETAN